MFRLKATLVATMAARPWRTGWSVDRGVDFSLTAAARPAAVAPAARGDVAPAERACFIDEDWAVPPGVAVVRNFVSLAAAEAVIEDAPPEAAGLRAWWSVASKSSRT